MTITTIRQGTLRFGIGLVCPQPFFIRCCGADSTFWAESDPPMLDSLYSMIGQEVRLVGYFWLCGSPHRPVAYVPHVSEAVLEPCPPAPVEPSTWGEVKARGGK